MSDKTADQPSLFISKPGKTLTSAPVLKKEKPLPKANLNSADSLAGNLPASPADNRIDRRCRQAIRHFCLECQGRLPKAVDACEDEVCPLYLFRLNDPESRLDQPGLPIRPLRAVRQQCLACCAGERDEIRNCSAGKSCSLWEFRFGVSPAVYRRVKERLRGPKHFTLPGLNLEG